MLIPVRTGKGPAQLPKFVALTVLGTRATGRKKTVVVYLDGNFIPTKRKALKRHVLEFALTPLGVTVRALDERIEGLPPGAMTLFKRCGLTQPLTLGVRVVVSDFFASQGDVFVCRSFDCSQPRGKPHLSFRLVQGLGDDSGGSTNNAHVIVEHGPFQ